MKRSIFVIATAMTLSTSLVSFAQRPAESGAPPKVESALKRAYLGYTWKVTGGPRQVNGVNVYDVTVTDKFGQSLATVTEDGDFLLSSVPTSWEHTAGPVKNAIGKLFKATPQSVDRYTLSVFMVDLQTAGGTERVVFDAVGRVKDIKSGKEIAHTDAEYRAEGEDTDPRTHKRMEELMVRIGDKGTIEHIYKDPNVDAFYSVEMKNDVGKDVYYLTNGNDLFSRRVQIGEKALPEPVKQTLHELFASDAIQGIYRRRYDYYQFTQPAPGDDMLTMKVGVDGVVLDISSAKEKEENDANAQRSVEVQRGPRL